MLRFYSSLFAIVLAHLIKDVTALRVCPDVPGARDALKTSLKEVSRHMREISASHVVQSQADRLVEKFDEFGSDQMCAHCESLFNNIITEIGQSYYFKVDHKDKIFFQKEVVIFGDQVNIKFPDARDDICAAGRCFALGEYNASVFHSMRVLEHGLRVLSTDVGLAGFDLENWKNIIDQIEKKIRELESLPKSSQKTEMLRRYSSAAVQFRYFKDAWRNHCMHSRGWYDKHTSKSVFEHVKQFMVELAA